MVLRFTRMELHNWRNFASATATLNARAFVVGPNAVGKSNFLDSFRFLHDLAADSGGLQEAVTRRGGLTRVRSLSARRKPNVVLDATLGDDDAPDQWRYRLEFGGDAKQPPRIEAEQVWMDGRLILSRPDTEDRHDPARLAQTHLEQVNANKDFRPIHDFFAKVQYRHVVPQLIREPDRSVNHRNDPYGGDFLDQIARTNKRTRESRLRRIVHALQAAVPQLSSLSLVQDQSGAWHLQGRYEHWRAQPARQDETVFSDGTLRLIGLLWSILDGDAPLLLEEPELSLHPAVVKRLPQVFARLQRSSKRQIILSTHSSELLDDEGIGLDEVILLEPGDNGTTMRPAADLDDATSLLAGGSTLSEVLVPRTSPRDVAQLVLFSA